MSGLGCVWYVLGGLGCAVVGGLAVAAWVYLSIIRSCKKG